MNKLEDPSILSPDMLDAMTTLCLADSEIVFGGSIALAAVGLLDRPIKDIDIFLKEGRSVVPLTWFCKPSTTITSETVTNTNGVPVQRTGMTIGGVRVCCFKVAGEELSHSIVQVGRHRFRIQNVNYAIQAKLSYAGAKHKADLEHIFEVLKTI